MANFQEIFGFQPAEAGKSQSAVHQFVVDSEISRLAREVEAARYVHAELNWRFIVSGKADNTAVLTEVLAAMTDYQADIAKATAAFDEAVNLAQGAGFSVRGEVVDNEAKRIFGLEAIHRPNLNGAEIARINAVLTALAAAFAVAEFDLADAVYRAKSNPTNENIQEVRRCEATVAKSKGNFWVAHSLAGSLGVAVSSKYTDHLPYECNPRFQYTTINAQRSLLEASRRAGLI